MGSLKADVRHAVRALVKAPVFTAVTVVTLALGIGANSAIFSLVNAVLLRPLGYVEPDRLMLIYEGFRGSAFCKVGVSPPDFVDLTTLQRSFSSIGAYRTQQYELSGAGEPEQITGVRVSASVFPILGVSAGTWAHVSRIGGSAGAGRGGAQLRTVAATIRRRPERRRSHDDPRPPPLHDRRHHAGVVPVSEAWTANQWRAGSGLDPARPQPVRAQPAGARDDVQPHRHWPVARRRCRRAARCGKPARSGRAWSGTTRPCSRGRSTRSWSPPCRSSTKLPDRSRDHC